jgi:hypothetical protein
MTFRHRHFRLSSLIEIAGVEEGKVEVGERKKKCVKRRSLPSHYSRTFLETQEGRHMG